MPALKMRMRRVFRFACRAVVGFALFLALADSGAADGIYKAVQSSEAFGKVKLPPRPGPWGVSFICYSKCDVAFNEKIRKAFTLQSQGFAKGSNQTPPRYIVIYSGEYDAGDGMMRLDNSALDALTQPYRTEGYIHVDLLLSVDPKLPCDWVDYGVSGYGVDFVVIDYVAYGRKFETYYEHPEMMIEKCTRLSVEVFQRP
jgi:hypothetical protein